MGLREEFDGFLRQRLSERSQDMKNALLPLVQEGVADGQSVRIEIFGGHGLTESIPISVLLQPFDLRMEHNVASVADRVSESIAALPPLLSDEEHDNFMVWEDGPYGRQVTIEQPTDGVADQALLDWTEAVWTSLPRKDWSTQTTVGIHDLGPDFERVLTKGAKDDPGPAAPEPSNGAIQSLWRWLRRG